MDKRESKSTDALLWLLRQHFPSDRVDAAERLVESRRHLTGAMHQCVTWKMAASIARDEPIPLEGRNLMVAMDVWNAWIAGMICVGHSDPVRKSLEEVARMGREFREQEAANAVGSTG